MPPVDIQTGRKRRNLKSELIELRRETIMATAAELFAEAGFHNVTVEAVADALGTTKPYIYNTFRDKNDLLFSICRRGADLTDAAIEDARGRAGRAIDLIAEYCRAYAELVIDNRTFIGVYAREDVNLTAAERSEIARLRADIDQKLTHLIEAAVKAGDAVNADPKTTATAIGVMISALWFWYSDKKLKERRQVVETLVRLSLRMVGAKGAI